MQGDLWLFNGYLMSFESVFLVLTHEISLRFQQQSDVISYKTISDYAISTYWNFNPLQFRLLSLISKLLRFLRYQNACDEKNQLWLMNGWNCMSWIARALIASDEMTWHRQSSPDSWHFIRKQCNKETKRNWYKYTCIFFIVVSRPMNRKKIMRNTHILLIFQLQPSQTEFRLEIFESLTQIWATIDPQKLTKLKFPAVNCAVILLLNSFDSFVC